MRASRRLTPLVTELEPRRLLSADGSLGTNTTTMETNGPVIAPEKTGLPPLGPLPPDSYVGGSASRGGQYGLTDAERQFLEWKRDHDLPDDPNLVPSYGEPGGPVGPPQSDGDNWMPEGDDAFAPDNDSTGIPDPPVADSGGDSQSISDPVIVAAQDPYA